MHDAAAPPTTDPTSRRPSNRRDLILEAAIELFHQRGYPATGVDDIGKAVDVSGPAIYRHFSSKEEILLEAMRLAADEVQAAIQAVEATAAEPRQLLEGYVRSYIKMALERSALIAVWTSEARHLSTERRSPMTRRLRAWTNDWVEVLRSSRPELTPEHAGLLVAGTIGMITSTATSDRQVPDLEDRLTIMALATLHAPVDK